MKKHSRGMKHLSGSGKSRTLKERQRQINAKCIRNGYESWEVPYPDAA